MKKTLISVMLFLVMTNVSAQVESDSRPFITVWNTENPGYSNNRQILIPGAGSKYLIVWEEVGNPHNAGKEIGKDKHTVTFPKPGKYEVRISGDFTRIIFGPFRKIDGGKTELNESELKNPDDSKGESIIFSDSKKILEVKQWGDIRWSSMRGAFCECENLKITANDIPDLQKVTDMSFMFYNAISLNSNISHWDVSNINNMNAMFTGAKSFNQNIGKWDVSSVTEMNGMLDYSGMSVKNYDNTLKGWSFQNVKQKVKLGANGLTYSDAGKEARTILVKRYKWEISGDTYGDNRFITIWKTDNPGISDKRQITIPGGAGKYFIEWEEVGNPHNTGKETGYGSHTITFPKIGIYEVRISGDFNRIRFCPIASIDGDMKLNGDDIYSLDTDRRGRDLTDSKKILEVKQWGNIKWSSMNGAFWQCENLQITAKDAPDLRNVTDMTNMFYYATSLRSGISHWDVSKVTNMTGMFYYAKSFNCNIGGWDITSVSNMWRMLDYTSLSVENYDKTLIGWNSQNVKRDVALGVKGLKYSSNGIEARENLINYKNWKILGDLFEENSFITIWKTENPGASENNQIKIPGYGEWYLIEWEEVGNPDNYGKDFASGEHIVTFPRPGKYEVRISGEFNRICFGPDEMRENRNDALKILEIKNWGDIKWSSMNGAFRNCVNLKISAEDAPDFSNVTSMRGMFLGASSLDSEIGYWDVSNVTDMSYMFYGATSFNGDISEWNVSNVTDMSAMFFRASDFNQDIGNWDVGSVVNMSRMFAVARSFNKNLGSWNIKSIVDMSNMLDVSGLSVENYDSTLIGWAGQSLNMNVPLGASGLEYCNGSFARQHLTDYYNWEITGDAISEDCGTEFKKFITVWKTDNPGFSDDDQIKIPGVGENYFIVWKEVGNPANTDSLFGSGEQIVTFPNPGVYEIGISGEFQRMKFGKNSDDRQKLIDVKQWGDIEWTAMDSAFFNCHNLEITADDEPDLSNVTSMSFMFFGVGNFDSDIGSWDVSNVENMYFLFAYDSSFNQDISGWNVSNVTNMGNMFRGAIQFNQDISSWDVSNVENMTYMFNNASQFNQDLGSWDASNVKYMA